VVASGNGQSTSVGSAFDSPLVVTVEVATLVSEKAADAKPADVAVTA
jgi:hypothetical protein